MKRPRPTKRRPRIRDLGAVAYDAYTDALDPKFRLNKWPWSKVPRVIKNSWRAAALAVAQYLDVI